MQKINEIIRNKRKELKMSYAKLSDMTNISKSTLQRYETGVTEKVPIDAAKKIAMALDLNIDYLYDSIQKNNISSYSPIRKIPVLGEIRAGVPLYAEQNIEAYTSIDIDDDSEYFALRVIGDSMDAARIKDGDMLIVRRQSYAENGEIVVALVDDSAATVKKFYQSENTVTLVPQSTNPKHPIQIYDLKKTSVKILGKVVQIKINI